MAESRAGWYPDPSGDQTKLRYWDGSQWTNEYTDSPTYATGTQEQGGQYGSARPQGSSSIVSNRSRYAMSSQDSTLRLVAFIFCVLSLASSCWLIIPLAWMIPMTVVSWGIYKGTRPNTTAFGVCTLLFVSLVAGILLLVSRKDA